MATPYIGEIRIFAGNFAPVNWAFCDGSLIAISQNTTLFNLIGTTYGGDGVSTFALPDLRSRSPFHQGNSYVLGQTGGVETVTLTTNQIPALNPQLRLSPSAVVNGTFSIYLAAADGTAVATNRAARVSLFTTTNLALPASAWTLLPNVVVPSGTQLRADGFSVTNGFDQFFKAVEIP